VLNFRQYTVAIYSFSGLSLNQVLGGSVQWHNKQQWVMV